MAKILILVGLTGILC